MAVNRAPKKAGGEARVNGQHGHINRLEPPLEETEDVEGDHLPLQGTQEPPDDPPAPLHRESPNLAPSAREPLRAPRPSFRESRRAPPPPFRDLSASLPPPFPDSVPPFPESLRAPPPPSFREPVNARSPFAREPARAAPQYEGGARRHAGGRSAGISPWLFVMATALNTTVASVLAVIITLGVVRQQHSGAEPHDSLPPPSRPLNMPALATGAVRTLSLLPVGTADQPLRLEPQRPAPLGLRVTPEEAANEPFVMALSGAPAGTALLGANRVSADTWYVPSGALKALQIVVPDWSASVIEMTVALRGGNGDLAAQTKAWVSVLPATATAPAADEASVKDLLTKADRLVARGDIVGARAIYQRVAAMGSGAGALALGATYDPTRLWSLGVFGLVGNRERAKLWYERAEELGNPEAKARIEALPIQASEPPSSRAPAKR